MAPMEAAARQRLLTQYPALAEVPANELSSVLQADAQHAEVPGGTLLFEEGTPCRGFPMVLRGSVRVARGSPAGRSLDFLLQSAVFFFQCINIVLKLPIFGVDRLDVRIEVRLSATTG